MACSSAARAQAPTTDNRPLAGRMAAAIATQRDANLTAAAGEKLKMCLLDFLACAFEAHSLPWARQAA